MELVHVPLPQSWFRCVPSSPLSLTHPLILHALALAPPDLGKVLIGIQVPKTDYAAFDVFLKELDYPYKEETDNPVYLKYLRA